MEKGSTITVNNQIKILYQSGAKEEEPHFLIEISWPSSTKSHQSDGGPVTK